MTRTITPGGPTLTPTRTSTSTPTATSCPYACDDFARADAATLGAAVTGGTWSLRPRDATAFGVCSSQACAPTASGDGAYAILPTGLSDHAAQVTVAQQVGTTGTAGLVVRARANWSRFLLVELTNAGELILWRYDGGWTALGYQTLALATGSQHTVGAAASGSP